MAVKESDKEGRVPAAGVEAKPVAEAKAAKAKPAAKESGRKSLAEWWQISVQFLREVKNELRKVTWPTRRQTVASTGVVLVLVTIVSVFLGLVDLILVRVVRGLIG